MNNKNFATPGKPTLLIAAGGTGGHIFPGLAVAEQATALGADVIWLGQSNGMEATHVPPHKIPFYSTTMPSLRSQGKLALLQFPFRFAKAMFTTWQIFSRTKPDVVLGMGGFVSGPAALVAWMRGIPLVIHEQNAIPGFTNRYLQWLTTHRLESFPGTFDKKSSAFFTGNPMRQILEHISSPSLRRRGQNTQLRLLILGGSQGATFFNQVLPALIATLPKNLQPEIWHQTGTRDEDMVRNQYQTLGVQAKVSAFISDMSLAYDFADIVLSRAGATTIAELCLAGLPAILVPLPTAADDHQTANAQYLVQANAAVLIAQNSFTRSSVTLLWQALHSDRLQVQTMAEQAYALRRPQAANVVAKYCLDLTQ